MTEERSPPAPGTLGQGGVRLAGGRVAGSGRWGGRGCRVGDRRRWRGVSTEGRGAWGGGGGVPRGLARGPRGCRGGPGQRGLRWLNLPEHARRLGLGGEGRRHLLES